MIITQQVEFPDVSFWQGVIDWSKMGSAAIIRAGQGAYVDVKFKQNRAGAVANNCTWGIYWFYDDRFSPSDQARKLASLFVDQAAARPQMEIYCDWENTYNGKWQGVENVVAFMQLVENLLPWARVGIYTGYYFFIQNTDLVRHANQLNYLKQRPLWLAWYATTPDMVQIPRPWKTVNVWQYGTPARGAEFGVATTEIDMNWFNGTTADFAARYGGAPIDPPNPPIGDTMIIGTALATVKIRETPNGVETGRYLYAGDKIEADRHEMQWLHLTKINGVVQTSNNLWSSAGSQQQYISWQEVPTPPDPPQPPVVGSAAFTLSVAGYKPFTGLLEPQ